MLLILRERLLNKLSQRKEELTNLLLQDKVDDFPSYRYLTGKIRGIDDSIDLIKNVFKGDENNEG